MVDQLMDGARGTRAELLAVLALARAAGARSFPVYGNPSWLIPQWYIDGQNATGNASDTNPGTNPLAPLLTWQRGLLLKWGTDSPKLPQDTAVTMLSSMAAGDSIQLGEPLLDVAQLVINRAFVPLPGGPTLIGAVTPKDHTAALPGGLLTVTYNQSVARGMLIENTTAGKSSRAFVWGNVLADIGQMYQPFNTPTIAVRPDPYTPAAEVNSWTVGDTVAAYPDIQVTIGTIGARGGKQNAAFTQAVVWLQGLHVLDPSGVLGNSEVGPFYRDGVVALIDCWLDAYTVLGLSPFYAAVQTVFNGAGDAIVEAVIYGGGAGSGSGFPFNLDGGAGFLDGDFIADGGMNFRAQGNAGNIGIPPGKSLSILNGYAMYRQSGLAATPDLFGGGTLSVRPRTACMLASPTWAASTFVTIAVPTSPGGSHFDPAAGTWSSPAIAFTPANLDANGGALSDPNLGVVLCLSP